MEPLDGPVLFTFANGCYCGGNLDLNGLRPCRWITTTEDFIICASEVGAISIPPKCVSQKGQLQPGKMLLVDKTEGRIVDNTELKMLTARKRPFKQWIKTQQIRLPEILDSLGSSIQVSIAECLCHRGPPRTDWDMGLSAQNRLSRDSQGTVDEVKKQIELD
ncbi:nucleophile aminohydrolase [Phakopsora pachyrhizi]|nr:nucleophile aminohydrolase [Phakopsora pachyrhizi]